jgi:hypothetical protein
MILVLSAMFFITSTSQGQEFFFIGEYSFPCTETFTLQSNLEDSDVNDLKVLFGKDKTGGVFIVSIKTVPTVRIKEKLIIYLEDGTVISLIDKGINDNVDNIASSAYFLTEEDLTKMKNSNILKVRYILKCEDCFASPSEGIYSASNKGSYKTDFPAIITAFYD